MNPGWVCSLHNDHNYALVLEYCERVLVKIKPECDACKMLDRPIVHGDCLSKLFTEEKCRDIFRQMVLGIEYCKDFMVSLFHVVLFA